MGHIFISYSHKDTTYAHGLAEHLRNMSFDTWIDERLDYGSQWPHEIQRQLDSCDAFILIMTPRSFASDWVQSELQRAKRKLKPIFPLLLEGDEPWLSVESTQYYDVRGGVFPDDRFYSAIERVVSTSQNVQTLSKLPTASKKYSDKHQPKMKTELLAAIIGGVATVIAACATLLGPFLDWIDLGSSMTQTPLSPGALVQETQPPFLETSTAFVPSPGITSTGPSELVSIPATATLPPTQTSVPPTNTPAPTSTTIPANFYGEWWTNFAVIKLQQTGNIVSGTYVHYGDNAPLPINGTVEGSVLRGEANDDFEFRMNATGSYFDGWWDVNHHFRWCGVRSGRSLPDGCGFSGTWKLSGVTWMDQAEMTVVQTGGTVAGQYTAYQNQDGSIGYGDITGTLNNYGYHVNGTWMAGGGSGPLQWRFVDRSWNQFVGYFMYQGDSTEMPWCGQRNGAGNPCP